MTLSNPYEGFPDGREIWFDKNKGLEKAGTDASTN